MDNNNKLTGKNVLVTAGAQGIGEAITRHFIDSGANVAIHYFSSADTANQLTEYATSKGQKAVAIGGDLTKEADANAMVEKTVEVLGGLDILINNAGSLVARNLLSDMETEFWHKVMDINLTSMMLVTRAAAPHLAKNDSSSIVNLASLAGRKGGHPGSLAYATSKGAILTFTRALSTEFGPQGTRVNAVAPGLILGTSFHNTHTTKESAAATTAGIPIQRAGNADDVARAVLYLASEYDGFITGATLDINGGVYNMQFVVKRMQLSTKPRNLIRMKKSIAIICAGGPAPGINTVVSTVAKVFLKDGYRVLGVHHGYKGLFSDEVPVKEFNFSHADRIFSRGGSTLIMSRFKPKDTDFRTAFFEKENVKLLVTIGGDDTASTANRITKFLEEKGLDIANIHVPKTIDNDLPLPGRNPTFGFHSAKDEGVKIGNTLYEDARTTGMWYIMSSMGRSAGHLAFGIGTACHFPMIIIPEMFDKSTPTIEKIINLMVSTIVKRRIQGIHYGVIIISEGVFHAITEEEILNAGIRFTFDAHGHPELGNISKASFFNVLLQEKLKALDLNIKTRPNDVGYELRCCRPIGFDLTLCSLLGIGVQKLYQTGISGCIVSADAEGNISPVYLSDHEDENGKVKPRLVNMESEISRLFFKSLDYITAKDYSRAADLLDEPAAYDFHKILNW